MKFGRQIVRDKVKWLAANHNALTFRDILMLSATINLTLVLHHSMLPVT